MSSLESYGESKSISHFIFCVKQKAGEILAVPKESPLLNEKAGRWFLKMIFDLSELVGQSLSLVRREGTSWSFCLNGGDIIFTEEPWRLITPQGILVSSADDAEHFGLPDEIDAAELLMITLQAEAFTEARYNPATGDLELQVADGRTLQFLQLSSGYESWRLHLKDSEFICLGGGGLAEFPRPHTA